MSLKDKKIILGISGSISAYKAPLILRELVKLGAEVICVMTDSAQKFVTKDTLANLSKNQVITDLFDSNLSDDGAWHVKLAHWADLMVIAPCSATTIGKIANGISDNALLLTFFSLPKKIPVILFPAMDHTMWENPIVQNNVEKIKSFNYQIIEPEIGELSSGLFGKGRLPEIENIIKAIKNQLFDNDISNDLIKLKNELNPLYSKKILISAGPTIEKIDEVRFLSNFSSGKMGYSLAKVANNQGMEVHLVTGKVNLIFPDGAIIHHVESADEMYSKVLELYSEMDIIIMAAAVADFKPKNYFDGKIKKSDSELLNIELVKNPDILKSIGNIKKSNQILVGFALETENGLTNAYEKLKNKNADLIVLNYKNDENDVFNSEFNKITLLSKEKEIYFEKMSKDDCASEIFNFIKENFLHN